MRFARPYAIPKLGELCCHYKKKLPKGGAPSPSPSRPAPVRPGPRPGHGRPGAGRAGLGPAPARNVKNPEIHFSGARKIFFKTPPDVLQRARQRLLQQQIPNFSAQDRCFESCGLNISFMGRIPESETVRLNTSSGKGGRRRRRRRRRRPPRSYHRQVGYVVCIHYLP